MTKITIDRELHGHKWAHFGCPECGYIAALPLMSEEVAPWCVHNSDNVIWPWFLENYANEDGWAGPMVPIIVTVDESE